MKKFYVSLFIPILALALCACNDKDPVQEEVPEPTTTPQPTVYTNASLVYYGVEYDEMPSSLFELTMYTDMELDESSNPIGPGHILRVSFNAELFSDGATEFPLPAAKYYNASSISDFTPGTFNYGYMNRLDLPTGAVEVPAGSFYGQIAEGETTFDADLLTDGYCEVTVAADGTYTVSGVMVGQFSTKRRFTYTGELKTIDRSDHTPEVKDSTLESDLTLTTVTKARLQDKGDAFYLQDESYRLFELYLAESSVDLTSSWPAGDGKLIRLELFVPWTADVRDGVPAGVYTVVPRINGGISRTDIVPGNMPAGLSGKFTYPSGCWYEDLSDGVMQHYACIAAGQMTVTSLDGATRFEIDLLDAEGNGAHHVRCDWTGTPELYNVPAAQ